MIATKPYAKINTPGSSKHENTISFDVIHNQQYVNTIVRLSNKYYIHGIGNFSLMKTAGLTTTIFFILCLYAFAGFSQSNWKLTKNKEGIQVSQRDSKYSNYKSIKVECTLEGNFDKLVAIINNVSQYKDWVYNNRTTSLIKRISPYEFYYYTETFLPWPLDNRDAVMHTRILKENNNSLLKINSVAVSGYVPQKSDKVRITRSDINWLVTKASANSIHIVYTFETDPGGNVPSWLVNSFADKGPFESFKALGALLKK
ncbi:MAG: START domain-containing protein [Flavisolibacter sp.]